MFKITSFYRYVFLLSNLLFLLFLLLMSTLLIKSYWASISLQVTDDHHSWWCLKNMHIIILANQNFLLKNHVFLYKDGSFTSFFSFCVYNPLTIVLTFNFNNACQIWILQDKWLEKHNIEITGKTPKDEKDKMVLKSYEFINEWPRWEKDTIPYLSCTGFPLKKNTT